MKWDAAIVDDMIAIDQEGHLHELREQAKQWRQLSK